MERYALMVLFVARSKSNGLELGVAYFDHVFWKYRDNGPERNLQIIGIHLTEIGIFGVEREYSLVNYRQC